MEAAIPDFQSRELRHICVRDLSERGGVSDVVEIHRATSKSRRQREERKRQGVRPAVRPFGQRILSLTKLSFFNSPVFRVVPIP